MCNNTLLENSDFYINPRIQESQLHHPWGGCFLLLGITYKEIIPVFLNTLQSSYLKQTLPIHRNWKHKITLKRA
jgi:hypothetical protein